MAVIHMSEAEATSDFAGVMARVHSGDEVVIESASKPAIHIHLPPQPRSLSESIALAQKHEEELGYAPVMDEEFAADMREIIANRRPRDLSAWDE